MKPSAPAPVASVDDQNPWLGLVSFTEETRGYFHGREEEAAELSRRVQRKLLTILFGQSGLGKTSILQAGLVPRLRPEGFCPVYVRLDYSPGSPSPSEQIKRAVFQATQAAGTWTQVGASTTGETLWEFLHHRDDVLKDAGGRTLIPILIFDQFEEIFTLAQSDDAGRRRAQEFLTDLSDLVENRPPVSLEQRIDRDEADAGKFDFARADYRILISLREDYLAHLEGLKGQMPSVTQNRMRLARMSGPQAVAAVCAPAPHLVTETVAEAIVRFVAGGADLARAEVEPSLLSLICRELNNTRLAKGHAEISADLLAGSRDTILSEFYERALADQPAGVRVFIEDVMLTDSGFRESVAEERVRKAFVAAGAAPDALAVLVNRRLLRVEDRLDLRRVEITHDVLCSVIAASRGVRREREALDESKRQLAAQREREEATRRSLVRARAIAAVSAVLMLVAAGSAVFGWINLRRAREADAQTQAARQLAENARGESEKLVGFLLDEFYEELQPTGRVEIIKTLADRAVSYYDGLPPNLVTPQTKLYHGMALVRKAGAMGASGDTVGSVRVSDQATALFQELRSAGDMGEETSLGLALAKLTRATSGFGLMNHDDFAAAAALLKPFEAAGHASRETKLTLADAYNFLCHSEPPEQGVAECEEARRILAGIGALDFSDLTASSIYADVADSQARIEMVLKRNDEAGRLENMVADMGQKVLAKRPGDLRAMKDIYFADELLSQIASANEDLVEAESYSRKTIEAALTYMRFNPADTQGWYSYIAGRNQLGRDFYEQGRIGAFLEQAQETLRLESEAGAKADSDNSYYSCLIQDTLIEARLGHANEAAALYARTVKMSKIFVNRLDTDDSFKRITEIAMELLGLDLLAAGGDYAAVYPQSLKLHEELKRIVPKSVLTEIYLSQITRGSIEGLIESELRTGRFEAAAAAAGDFLAHPPDARMSPIGATYQLTRMRVLVGRSQIGLGRMADARTTLDEALTDYHERRGMGASGTSFRIDFASCLYQFSRVQPDDGPGRAERKSLLDSAAGVLFGLSPEAQELIEAKELNQWVSDARAQAGT